MRALWNKIKSALLSPKSETSVLTPQRQSKATNQHWLYRQLDDIPRFTLWYGEMMLLDPAVSFGLAVRNGPLHQVEFEVDCDNPAVELWVEAELDKIKEYALHQMLKTKRFGYLAFETFGELDDCGHITLKKLKMLHPRFIRPLTRNGEIVGFTVSVNSKQSGDKQQVYAPKGIWLHYNSDFENPWGKSILQQAQPPFVEKWADQGALNLRRLRMVKDAWIGDRIKYPVNRKVLYPDGKEVSWRDVAREMGETRMSGGMLTIPSYKDANGNDLIEYEPPVDTSQGATQIFDYVDKLDVDMWRAFGVPNEVIQASETGSGFSGRAIPFTSFLTMLDIEMKEIVHALHHQWLRPVSILNFGCDHEFSIRTKPLSETFDLAQGDGEAADDGGQKQPDGAPPEAGPNNLNGRGQELKSNRSDMKQMGGSSVQSQTQFDHAPAGGVTVQGREFKGGQFIPADVMAQANERELAAVSGSGAGESSSDSVQPGAEPTSEPTGSSPETKLLMSGPRKLAELFGWSTGKIDRAEPIIEKIIFAAKVSAPLSVPAKEMAKRAGLTDTQAALAWYVATAMDWGVPGLPVGSVILMTLSGVGLAGQGAAKTYLWAKSKMKGEESQAMSEESPDTKMAIYKELVELLAISDDDDRTMGILAAAIDSSDGSISGASRILEESPIQFAELSPEKALVKAAKATSQEVVRETVNRITERLKKNGS